MQRVTMILGGAPLWVNSSILLNLHSQGEWTTATSSPVEEVMKTTEGHVIKQGPI